MAPSRALTGLLLAATLAGCAGVPRLPSHELGKSALTVTDIENEITCELSAAGDDLRFYYVTVLLTLQVDDSADFTPSLGALNPLTGSYSFAATLSGDLGGARQRTFTTTYTLDGVSLRKAAPDPDCKAGRYKPGLKPYSLAGDLGLVDIFRDGAGALALDKTLLVTPATDKTPSSFGSKVQFIVTQSLTGVGPLWTIRHFKGPSGSNGILSGKRLDTDSVLITFAPRPPADGEKKLVEDVEAKTVALAAAKKALDDMRKRHAVAEAERLKRSPLLAENPSLAAADRAARAMEKDAEARQTSEVDGLRTSLEESRIQLDAIHPAVDAPTAAASQSLLTDMLLQNLSVLH